MVGTIITANSSTVPAGSVISQTPIAGVSVPELTTVNLVVSLGPQSVTVPHVVDLDEAAAKTAITTTNLTVGTITTANSSTVPAGQVISQTPGATGGLSASAYFPRRCPRADELPVAHLLNTA